MQSNKVSPKMNGMNETNEKSFESWRIYFSLGKKGARFNVGIKSLLFDGCLPIFTVLTIMLSEWVHLQPSFFLNILLGFRTFFYQSNFGSSPSNPYLNCYSNLVAIHFFTEIVYVTITSQSSISIKHPINAQQYSDMPRNTQKF